MAGGRNCVTVLIVEDEPDIRELLQQALELEGYRVCTATNGREAVSMLAEVERPCLILLDLMMPVMNGWEFLEVQKKDLMIASIPVIVVSAVSDPAEVGTRAKAFIRKPVDLDRLLTVVEQYCA